MKTFLGGFILFVAAATTAMAQSELGRVEIGAMMTNLYMRDFQGAPNQPGYGGRLTINLNRNVALDSELSYLPIRNNDLGYVAKHAVQGVAGVKAGYRAERWGIYGKVRPGATHFKGLAEGVVCVASFPFSNACIPRDTTRLTIDFGGVVEIYGKKTLLRFDVGDTVIRFGDERAGITNFNRNNLQYSFGVGYRF